jgi:hypothetical protein
MDMAIVGILLGLILIVLLDLLLIVGQRPSAVERVPVRVRRHRKS